MSKMSCRVVVSLALLVGAIPVSAERVSTDQAAAAVRGWIGGGRVLGQSLEKDVASVQEMDLGNGVSCHVVCLASGGFVVTGADTTVEPVVAFAATGDVVKDAHNPLWALLKADFSARSKGARSRLMSVASPRQTAQAVGGTQAKWAALIAAGSEKADPPAERKLLSSAFGVTKVSDVRVGPLVKSAWSQADYRNLGPGKSADCYNYYTPYHWPCGCVATAGAQLMRYHMYPDEPVEAGSYECYTGVVTYATADYVDYRWEPATLKMIGGSYDWESMTLVPAKGCTKASREAIGKLTYDVGVSCNMAYFSEESSASVYMLQRQLVDRFKYANAASVTFDDNGWYKRDYSYTLDRFKSAVVPNFDAGLPVLLGISHEEGGISYGHAVVGDGYGYSGGDFYVHINLGWANAGSTDVWYMPPNVDVYTAIDTIVYNVYPKGQAGASIVSGRVLDTNGRSVAGVTVTATSDGQVGASAVSDAKGIYALRLKPGKYQLVARTDGRKASTEIAVAACVSTAYTKDGGYMRDPVPSIGNVCDQDLTLLEATPDDPAPGIWTTNVSAVRKAALADGAMIALLSSNAKTCGYCQALDELICGKSFLEWARQKGVYLVSADESKYSDTAEAREWFRSASRSSEYPTIVFFDAKEGFPRLGEGVFREGRKVNGTVYESTLASLKTCFASFIPEYAEHWDDPIVTNEGRYEFAPRSPVTPLEVTVAGLPDPKIVVKGLPSGLKFTAKRLTVAKTKTAPAYEVGPNSIYGVPTKSGVYRVTVTATSADHPGVTASGEMTVVIRAAGESVVNVTWNAKEGKVSGAGVYKAGKKITLKAVAAKGYVFDRWNGLSDGTMARKASFSYVVPAEDVDLGAAFFTAEAVKKSIVVRNGEFTCDASVPEVPVKARQGVYRQWQLAAEAYVPVEEIKVSGLPSGLKFTAKAIVDKKTGETNVTANTIYGYATAASKRDGATGGFKPSVVSVTVKTSGKVTEKYALLMTVLPLPGWAIGNFAGTVETDGYCGPAKLTVGKTGKVSGSFSTLVDGKVKKWTYSAAGFDQADDDSCELSAVAKNGKNEISFRLAVATDGRQDGLAAATAEGEWDDGLMTLWRSVWSDSGAAARVAPMKGLYTARMSSEETGSGYLSLKVDAKGGVKTAGKLPDGTSASSSMTLVLQGEKFVAPWYQAPSAYAGGYVHSLLSLGADRSSGVEGEAEWTSLSDKATAEYGAGFSRTLSVVGSFYDSALALESQFKELFLAADSPDFEYAFKSTERDEKGKKRTESELRMAESMTETACAVTVGKNGKLSVPKATKPVKDKQTGVWSYAGENVEAVTVSFAKSTGVFKGTFTCWYDYLASVDSTAKTPEKTAHSSKKYSFEGVWVQGEPSLEGYFLVERTGSYEDGKSGKEKTYKYKLSVPAHLNPTGE